MATSTNWHSNGYPSDWERRRKRVYRRDNYECQQCGALGGDRGNCELHAHHIVPKGNGGSHSLSNLTTLCWSCHNAQHVHHIPRSDPTADPGGWVNNSSTSEDEDDELEITGERLSRLTLKKKYVEGEIDFEEFEKRYSNTAERIYYRTGEFPDPISIEESQSKQTSSVGNEDEFDFWLWVPTGVAMGMAILLQSGLFQLASLFYFIGVIVYRALTYEFESD